MSQTLKKEKFKIPLNDITSIEILETNQGIPLVIGLTATVVITIYISKDYKLFK